jgi:SEFIR domain-containing protein
MDTPKIFISYSWSDSSHEQWVIVLATELREAGVDVILDKWDLKEGHDAVAFMEKMVTDPDIKKVAIVTDEIYAEKADGRAGGVGTETQIISKEVYDNQEQDKFVAVVSQKDENGKPYLPTYYKSRIYIDLSEPDSYGENFEKLLRWIYDKPLYVKPEIGKKPLFLEEEHPISLSTTASLKRAVEGIKNNKPYAPGAIDEYLSTFSENLERFRIQPKHEEFDDLVIKNIENFIPYRNEIIQLIITINQYAPSEENIQKLHRFFESLIPYMKKPEHVLSCRDWDFDNYKFIIHELFLYAIAIFLKFEHFKHANTFLEQKYYLPGNSDYGRDVMVGFGVFREPIKALGHRNQRLGLRRLSLRADLLKDRCAGVGIEFRHLCKLISLFLCAPKLKQNMIGGGRKHCFG